MKWDGFKGLALVRQVKPGADEAMHGMISKGERRWQRMRRMMMPKPLQEFEQFILGQALAEIKTAGDIERVMAKVEGTALALNKRAMRTLRDLAEKKVALYR